MKIFQQILALFGRQYIFLEFNDGKLKTRHAYAIGRGVFANPYLPDTRAELLPGGKIGKGPRYVHGWRPITKKTFWLFDRVRDAA